MKGRRLSQERLGELLGRELGIGSYSGAAVSDWENGKSKIHADDRSLLISLIKILVNGGGCKTVEDANELLRLGNYRSLDESETVTVFGGAHFPTVSNELKQPGNRSNSFPWPAGIPDEPYHPLPGREKLIEEALLFVNGKRNSRLISVEGLGGHGKTALAAEFARRAIDSGLFSALIGETAKQEILVNNEIIQVEKATLGYENLLDAIGRQLELWEIFALESKAKEAIIGKVLHSNQYLVFIDNLETAENANAIVSRFANILGSSCAILTSRLKVQNRSVQALTLDGLSLADTIYFLHAEARKIGAQQILDMKDHLLKEIHEITGGSPLALKLITAQSKYLELDLILSQLRRAGSHLFPFIFQQSWNQLSETSQIVLIYIGRTVFDTVGVDELALAELAPNENDLIEAIHQLNAYSLLNASYDNQQMRYGIHQLTRQFVVSDLPQIWKEQGLF
jgi:transcriptional regulator with XRE-family HTH domain